jgi:hypothetical protein
LIITLIFRGDSSPQGLWQNQRRSRGDERIGTTEELPCWFRSIDISGNAQRKCGLFEAYSVTPS